MRKPRKNYMPPEKVAILRRDLIDRVPVSDLCDEYDLQPTLFYAWQKIFFENGAAAFERKSANPGAEYVRVIAALYDKLQRKNEVVAELMEEHIQLKKEVAVHRCSCVCFAMSCARTGAATNETWLMLVGAGLQLYSRRAA